MKDIVEPVRLPSNDESIAPVTILDAQGHVVRVVAVASFAAPAAGRRYSAPGGAPPQARWRLTSNSDPSSTLESKIKAL